MVEFYERARAALLPDGLVGASWRHLTRRDAPMHRRNPLVALVVARTRSLLAIALPEAEAVKRNDLERLVAVVIEEVAASHAVGLSPEERDEAVSDMLDECLAAAARPAMLAAA